MSLRPVAILCIVCIAVGVAAGRLWPASPKAVEAYLQRHPEFLADNRNLLESAGEIVRQRLVQDQRVDRRALFRTDWLNNPDWSSMPRLGRINDPIIVVEFSDFECVPCRAISERVDYIAASNPDTQIVQVYVPRAGSGSELAARVAIAVWLLAPEHYRRVHDALMATPIMQLETAAYAWLEELDSDDRALTRAIGEKSVREVLRNGRQLFDEMGAYVVPTFLIDGRLLVGNEGIDSLQDAIDDLREQNRS